MPSSNRWFSRAVCNPGSHSLGTTDSMLLMICAALGDRDMAVCRELTKWHEEIFHGLISEAIDHFDEPRGEFVLVVTGSNEILNPISNDALLDAVALELGKLKKSGYHARDAVAQVAAEHKLSRKTVYQLWLKQEG